jgi:hypothetical protein
MSHKRHTTEQIVNSQLERWLPDQAKRHNTASSGHGCRTRNVRITLTTAAT